MNASLEIYCSLSLSLSHSANFFHNSKKKALKWGLYEPSILVTESKDQINIENVYF